MKKGFFFTFDAILALGVLVVAFMLILSTFYHQPEQKQTAIYSEDLMDLFATTKVNEVQKDDVFRMWCDRCSGGLHLIENPENTLLEQMGEFYYKADSQANPDYYKHAETIARSISQGLVKQQYSYSIYINSTLIYNLTRTEQENATLLIAAKRLAYGMVGQQLWGPYIAEVRVWQ